MARDPVAEAQRRFAISGNATLADLPYLYANQAGQDGGLPFGTGLGAGADNVASARRGGPNAGGSLGITESGPLVSNVSAPGSGGAAPLLQAPATAPSAPSGNFDATATGREGPGFSGGLPDSPYPGRSTVLSDLAGLFPGGLAAFLAGANYLEGQRALDEYSGLFEQMTGVQPEFGFADKFAAGTGFDPFGSAYAGGLGGYGNSSFGAGGLENYINVFDPGVAGQPRAMARSMLANRGGGFDGGALGREARDVEREAMDRASGGDFSSPF